MTMCTTVYQPTVSRHHAPQHTAALPPAAPALPVMVVLGNPATPDCQQHGICRIDINNAPDPKLGRCPQAQGWLSRTDDARLRLVFEVERLLPCQRAIHFEGPAFKVMNAYALPAAIQERFAAPLGTATILPGEYPILHYAGLIEIVF